MPLLRRAAPNSKQVPALSNETIDEGSGTTDAAAIVNVPSCVEKGYSTGLGKLPSASDVFALLIEIVPTWNGADESTENVT